LKAEKTGCLLEAQGGDSGFRHTPLCFKNKEEIYNNYQSKAFK
jgi:hypothetical protein